MDTPSNDAGGAAGQRIDTFGKPPSNRSMTRYIKPTLWGLLILYVVLFLLANRTTTEVNFLFFSAEAPLVIALLVMFVLGVVVGGGAVMMRGRSGKSKKTKG